MMKKLHVLTILFSFLVYCSFGQVSEEELDEKYTPPQGSEFDAESNEDKNETVLMAPTHEFNFQMLHLLRSKLNFEYRHNFSDMFSAGMGFGYNFGPDYLLGFWSYAEYIVDLDSDYSLYRLLNNCLLYTSPSPRDS